MKLRKFTEEELEQAQRAAFDAARLCKKRYADSKYSERVYTYFQDFRREWIVKQELNETRK